MKIVVSVSSSKSPHFLQKYGGRKHNLQGIVKFMESPKPSKSICKGKGSHLWLNKHQTGVFEVLNI